MRSIRADQLDGIWESAFGLGIGLGIHLALPDTLQAVLDTFDMFPDPSDRTNMLLSYADQFREVPPEVATRPFDKSHQVPQCESDAYVWAMKMPDGTLNLHFAVENPSGVSAKALAAILQRSLSGLPAERIAAIDPSIVERIFRQNISMGKGMGLMSMVEAVRALARRAGIAARGSRVRELRRRDGDSQRPLTATAPRSDVPFPSLDDGA